MLLQHRHMEHHLHHRLLCTLHRRRRQHMYVHLLTHNRHPIQLHLPIHTTNLVQEAIHHLHTLLPSRQPIHRHHIHQHHLTRLHQLILLLRTRHLLKPLPTILHLQVLTLEFILRGHTETYYPCGYATLNVRLADDV